MAGPITAGASELEARLIAFVKENRLPGAAAAVVHADEIAWSAGVGFADLAAQRATDPAMLYRIASITKTFTGTAVMRLRDEGRLDLDDPAVAWLPELRSAVSPFGAIEAITIRRMLSHESGLAAEPPGTDWAIPTYQGAVEETLRQAGDITVALAPNTRNQYSDLAYQLLGEIVARAARISYPRYVREAILDPLGMSATGFEPLAGTLAGRRATGYTWRALSDELDLAPAMPPVWAEGGLWSCLHDLATWISFQLSAYQDPAVDSPVLAVASLREMHRPRYLADDQWSRAYGISWCGSRQDDVIWIGHAGGVPGFTASVCFDPREQVGAVALLNGTTGSGALGTDLASIARRLIRAKPPAIVAPAPMPRRYRPLLGIYARPDLGGWVLRLEWRDGKLTFITPEAAAWCLILTPTGDPDLFAVQQEPGLPGGEVTFRRRPGGRVASVVLMDTTWVRLDPVAA